MLKSHAPLLNETAPQNNKKLIQKPACCGTPARGQKNIAVAGPSLEHEAGKVHEGFWVS
jgi:hypothetical protein